jgi:hypoxanthine phosphoribosyltransferase
MMFRANALRSTLYRLTVQSREKSSTVVAATSRGGAIPANVLRGWYNTFGKSTAMYGTWLIMFIVIGEYVSGKATDGVWTMNNYGKTFTTMDWSKFDEFEEDEEEEEDEDDDDEE